MNNGNWFRWVVGGLILALAVLVGSVARDMNTQITTLAAAQSVQTSELAVLKSSYQDIQARLSRIESKVDRIDQRIR